MAQYEEAHSDMVSIRIGRKNQDTGKYSMDVSWTILGLETYALIIVVQRVYTISARAQPSLLWYSRTGKRTGLYLIPPGYYEFTVYGLVSTGLKKYKIVSSAQSLTEINNSGQNQMKLLFPEEHTMERSILGIDEINGPPFPLSMDKSRSHLLFSTPVGASTCQGLLLCQQQHPFQEEIILKGTHVSKLKSKSLEPVLPSRRHLCLKVLTLKDENLSPGQPELLETTRSSSVLGTKTYLSKADLQKLMDRALDHRRKMGGHQKVLLTHFFRNKPQAYFNNIFYNRGGLMETYRKDANGDQDSAINNGNLFGLFFSPALDINTLQPPNFSFFGDVRLLVAAPILFCERSRLYFADFYCNNRAHYITLVLTKQGSEADQFCQERLLELDPQTNPFLTREPASAAPARPATSRWYGDLQHHQSTTYQSLGACGGYSRSPSAFNRLTTSAQQQGYRSGSAGTHRSTAASSRPAKVYTTLCNMVHLEVLYTEDVHITALQQRFGETKVSWGWCPTRGRGSSLPNGIPKNPTCRVCNLPREDDASDSDDLSSLPRGLRLNLRW